MANIILNIKINIKFIIKCKYFKVALKFIRIMNIVKIKIILLLFKAQKSRNKILSPFHRRVVLSKYSHGVVIV